MFGVLLSAHLARLLSRQPDYYYYYYYYYYYTYYYYYYYHHYYYSPRASPWQAA